MIRINWHYYPIVMKKFKIIMHKSNYCGHRSQIFKSDPQNHTNSTKTLHGPEMASIINIEA